MKSAADYSSGLQGAADAKSELALKGASAAAAEFDDVRQDESTKSGKEMCPSAVDGKAESVANEQDDVEVGKAAESADLDASEKDGDDHGVILTHQQRMRIRKCIRKGCDDHGVFDHGVYTGHQ